MSDVKRYDLVGDMDGNCNLNEARMELSDDGVYVKHRGYEELQAKCAALAVEAAYLRGEIENHSQSTHFCGKCGEADPCITDDVCWSLKHPIPSTDAFLAEIEHKAIRKFINSIEHILRDKLSPYDTEEMLEAMRIFLEEHVGEQK